MQINYRHFEDDLNPMVIKKSGFKHLDRVIDICTKHKIYTVIDLHALPGGRPSLLLHHNRNLTLQARTTTGIVIRVAISPTV